MAVFKLGFSMFATILALLLIPDLIQSCTLSSGWINLSMNGRLHLSPIVVYGKTIQHQASVKQLDGKSFNVIDAVFHVYCVLKDSEEPVEEEIIIEAISPRDGCSGTKKHKQIGQEAIVALKPGLDGKYQYSEVMPILSATFPATRLNFFTISSICDMQKWISPKNAEINRCPVCGIANFTSHVMTDDIEDNSRCIVDDLQLDMKTCDLLVAKYDNSSVCVPVDYNVTCASLSYSVPQVSCECSGDDNRLDRGQFLAGIDAGVNTMPCVLVLITGLIATVMTV